MSHFLVTKADFEAFMELTNGAMTRDPGRSNSDIRVHFILANAVIMELNLRVINVTPAGHFYGNNSGWTHVRFDDWAWNNTTFRGEGSRSDETHEMAREILSLIGKFGPWDNVEGETTVTLVNDWSES